VAPWLVVVAVLLAWLTEFAGVLAQTVVLRVAYDGPLGKSDRAFVFGLLALLLAAGVPLAPYWNTIFALIVAARPHGMEPRCARAEGSEGRSTQMKIDLPSAVLYALGG